MIRVTLEALDRLVRQLKRPPFNFFEAPRPDQLRTGYGPVPGQEDPAKAQKESLHQLGTLLDQTAEALRFLKTLYDCGIMELAERVPAGSVAPVSALTFENLVTTPLGRDRAHELTSALLNGQIAKGVPLHALLSTLGEACPSFVKEHDRQIFKASELLAHAKVTTNRANPLREAVALLRQAAGHISASKLASICQEIANLRYHASAVDLCLRCANEADPTGDAVRYYAEGRPAGVPFLLLVFITFR